VLGKEGKRGRSRGEEGEGEEEGRRKGEGGEGGRNSLPSFFRPSTNKRPGNLANQAKILAPNIDLRMTGDLNYQLPEPSPPLPSRKLISIVTRNSLAKLQSRVPHVYDQNLFLSLLKSPQGLKLPGFMATSISSPPNSPQGHDRSYFCPSPSIPRDSDSLGP
jgi:hypothetical protein